MTSPSTTTRACICGCGADHDLIGHDQRAVQARVMRFGSARAFIEWFDQATDEVA
jgi:hypothetical protein